MARKDKDTVEEQDVDTSAEDQQTDDAETETETETELTPEGLEISTFSINSEKIQTHPKAYHGRTFRFRRLGPVTSFEDVLRQAQLLFDSPEALRDAINGQGVDLTNQKRIKDEGNAETPTGADELQESLMSWKIAKASRKRGSTKRQREQGAAKVVGAVLADNPELAEILRQKAAELGINL